MSLTFALLLTAEASLGDACGAGCGAAAAFGKEEKTIFALSLKFSLLWNSSIVLSDVGYFFVVQFHTIDIPRWSVMRISSRSRN